MLNSMREGAGAKIIKIVALGFVMAATAGMVFMDVGGFFRGGVGANPTFAKIGSVEIDQIAFERRASAILRQQNMSMEEAYRFGILKPILEEMISREAMRQEAQREGLMISDMEMASTVHDMVKPQVQPGETPQDALNRLLQAQGWTEGDLTSSLRQESLTTLIDTPLEAAGTHLPALFTDALARYQSERRDITFFTMTAEAAGKDIHADDETLRNYYEGVKDQYQIPEERSFKAIVLSADDIKDTVKITDEDVKTAYEERKDQFRIGERRKIEQVVLQDETAAKAASESARKGKALKSIDPKAYREPIDVDQAGLPAELGTAVFEAEKGTVLNPIKTPLGWHVVRVISSTPARTQTFAEVRADLRKELESDALHEEMESRISRIDEILGSGASLDEAAADLELAIRTVGPIDASGNFKEGETQDALLTALASNKDLLASLFELMEGETGDLAEIKEGLYAAFSLETVRPTQDRAFEDVKEELEKKYLTEERGKALNAAVDNAIAQIGKGEKTFEDAAKEVGAVVKTARDVSRSSKVAGLNDPIALTRLFDETDMNAVVRVPVEDGVILAKVLSARIPDAGKGKLSDEQREQLQSQMRQSVRTLYLEDIKDELGVKIYEDTMEKVYGAGADAQ